MAMAPLAEPLLERERWETWALSSAAGWSRSRVEREVEKCLDVGARIRVEGCDWPELGWDWDVEPPFAVPAVAGVVAADAAVLELELARKRDWEWLEK